MKRQLLGILIALEEKLPPSLGHHSITRMQYGSDQDGWSDRLSLNVRIPEGVLAFFLDDMDLEKPVDEFVAEIVTLTRERASNIQILPHQSV